MKRFLTIFPEAENVHLVKDVGMIPYVLYKDFGFDSTIACYKNSEYEYLDSQVNGLKQIFISKIFNIKLLDCVLFLVKNFHKYDILQCYHLDKNSLILSAFFKILKIISFKKSITYIKLDTDESIKKTRIKYIHKLLLKFVDYLSIETKMLFEFLNRKQIFKNKILYIPNGYYKVNDIITKYEEKLNLIITVGRIGTYQKNNEILLEAFKGLIKHNQDWKLELIGDIEEDFREYMNIFFEENPNLKNKVSLTGIIKDRNILELKYKKAKMFVLTSRYEGFPLVILEAMNSGCTIVTTNISAANELTNNGINGRIIKIGDVESLTQNLIDLTNSSSYLAENCYSTQVFVSENFNWHIICKELNIRFNNL